jgi:divalent metal cation (Fe/Co/Zn/Cd) transporter
MNRDDPLWSDRPAPSAARFVTIFVGLPISIVLCLLALFVSPYTNWGGERAYIRPLEAVFVRDLAYVALAALGAVSVALWAGRPRWRWWDYLLAFIVWPLIAATVLRIGYLIFWVGLPVFADLPLA